jgi:oxygen-independent coproporphyrinogen III oxidase
MTGFYFHYPFCQKICNYCDFYKNIKEGDRSDRELEKYLDEAEKIHDLFLKQDASGFSQPQVLDTIFFGGGTPSLWGDSGILWWNNFLIRQGHELAKDYEWTLEVNPGTSDLENVRKWVAAGVNRLSLGIQTLDNRFLPFLDRAHDGELALAVLGEIVKIPNVQVSVDFMIGLPHLEKAEHRNILKELEEILSYDIDHLSVYILTVKEHYRWYQQLPSEDFVANEYIEVSRFLKSRGFSHYEVSNFARHPRSESRHNLKYWRSESVLALGPSAVGFLNLEGDDSSSTWGLRYKWKPSTVGMEKEVLTKKEFYFERLYLLLRLKREDSTEIFSLLGEALSPKRCQELFDKWNNLNYLDKIRAKKEDPFHFNERGFLMMDSLLSDLY